MKQLTEVARMQQLAGIKSKRVLKENEGDVDKEFFVDFNESTPSTPQLQVLRTIVDELNSYEGDDHSITGAYQSIIDADESQEQIEFYGTLESNLQEFEKLPQNFIINTNINGYNENYYIIKTGDDSWEVK